MEIAVAALAAAALGWFGPRLVAALPEPTPAEGEEPDPTKPLYTDIAAVPRLGLWLALGSAVLAGVAATRVPVELLPAWVVFCAGGAILSYVDLRTRLLPFALTVLLHVACALLVGLGALLASDGGLLVRAIFANLVVFAVYWALWAGAARFGGGAFGYGDVRLAAIAGLVLGAVGTQEAVIGSYASFLIGAVAGIALAVAKLVDPKSFAFGPYIVLAAVVGVVLAPLL